MERRELRAVPAIATLLVAMSAGPSAFGQSPDRHAAALARFEEGTHLVEAGNCTAAIPKFVESLEREEGVGAHLNLADCYARTGATAQAWTQFKAAERFATLNRNDERREVAHNGAYALERKLLRLTLDIPFALGLEVRINGVLVERDLLGTRQVAIMPGRYVLEARATRKKPVIRSGSGAAGEVQSVVVAFEDDPAAMPPPVAPSASTSTNDESSGATQRTVGIVVGAVGLASLAAGSVFGIVALGKKADLKTAVGDDPRCTGGYPNGTCESAARAGIDSTESSAFTFATLSTVFLIAGGVLTATGATVFLTTPSSKSSKSNPPSTGGVTFTPRFGASSASLAASGSF